MACECGKAESCGVSHHPNSTNKHLPPKQETVEHLQRRPGETFAEMRERLAKE